jgi:hypothetical protein
VWMCSNKSGKWERLDVAPYLPRQTRGNLSRHHLAPLPPLLLSHAIADNIPGEARATNGSSGAIFLQRLEGLGRWTLAIVFMLLGFSLAFTVVGQASSDGGPWLSSCGAFDGGGMLAIQSTARLGRCGCYCHALTSFMTNDRGVYAPLTF